MTSAGRRPRRVLLGLTEISGYWGRMEQGLREIGIDAELVTLDPHPYVYGEEGRRWPLLVRALRRVRAGGRLGPLARPVELVLRCLLLVRCVLRYDTFVFGYHATFLQTRDLWLLRRLGKTVVTVFHGSDERPPWMDGYLGRIGDADLVAATARQVAVVARCDRHSHAVVSNPNSGQLHQRRAAVYHVVGNPVASGRAAVPGRPGTARDRTIRFLHAPSDPVAKGSDRVRAAVAAVASEGLAVELTEVQGVTNDALHAAILDVDVVTDQAFGDCPWAMLAAEAATLGRAVIVGGYGHDHLRAFVGDHWPPALYCHPDHLSDAVRELALDDVRRVGLADAAAAFAPRWAPAEVARRLLAVIDGTAPDEWYFEPADITYLWGGGAAATETRRRIGVVARAGGPGMLGLDGNPVLRDAAIEAADST